MDTGARKLEEMEARLARDAESNQEEEMEEEEKEERQEGRGQGESQVDRVCRNSIVEQQWREMRVLNENYVLLQKEN